MKKNITAIELMQKLQNDPDYQARINKENEKRLKLINKEKIEEEPIVNDLNALGFKLDRIHDLNKIKKPGIKAFSIVIKHLKTAYSESTRWGLARLLERKDANCIWTELKDIYIKENENWAKDGIAAALSESASPIQFNEIIKLIKNKENGKTRLYFTRNLSKSRNIEALTTLIELQNDPELRTEIEIILIRKKIKSRITSRSS